VQQGGVGQAELLYVLRAGPGYTVARASAIRAMISSLASLHVHGARATLESLDCPR